MCDVLPGPAQVKFNVNRVDNMVIQAIALLDTLDKDINTFVMRVREWYSWHFPELVRVVSDNYLYARLTLLIKDKAALSEAVLPGAALPVVAAETFLKVAKLLCSLCKAVTAPPGVAVHRGSTHRLSNFDVILKHLTHAESTASGVKLCLLVMCGYQGRQ